MAEDFRDGDGDRVGQPSRRRFPTRIVAVVVITLVCGAFISQNRERVNVDFLVFDRDARTWVVIILSMALGALLAEFVRLALKRRRQSSE
jgi:uncharacterized integral membrane protein